MHKEQKQRLSRIIFRYLLGFCALLLAVLWLFEVVLLDKMYEGIRKREIQRAVEYISAYIDDENLDARIKQLERDSEILVTPAFQFEPPQEALPLPPFEGGPPKRNAITEQHDFVNAAGETISFVFYAIISPVNATISTIKIQLYYVTGIMIGLSVILALLIARHVSRPMERLNESAKVMAQGNYDIDFAGEGYLEIHELAATLNNAATELQKVEHLRRELMANISHDLRTPLALIYSYAELMNDFPQEVTQANTKVIMEETSRLSSLVNDILDVSQLEAGIIELNLEWFSITECVDRTIRRVQELVAHDGYQITFEQQMDVTVEADKGKLMQAFYNLLINAIHYSNKERNIIVRQDAAHDRVRITVIDHGEGVAPEMLPYIWDRYYKGEQPHRRAIIGTGLGLSIVKKMIDLHGGTCGVDSTPNVGSAFWFEIPRKSEK